MVDQTAPDTQTDMNAMPSDAVPPSADAPMDDIPVDEAVPASPDHADAPATAPDMPADAPSDMPSDVPVDGGMTDMPVDAATAGASHVAGSSHAIIAQLAEIGGNTIYLMGLSFILGSLFTILILILLDFMRRNQPK